MSNPPPASVIFFGAYDPAYPRNSVLRCGLEENGAIVRECRASTHWRFWARYPLLVRAFLRSGGAARKNEKAALRRFIFVPEFCAKDVSLAKLLGLLTARRVVFDPLAARYETKILDWRRKPPSSLTAWWNSVTRSNAALALPSVLSQAISTSDQEGSVRVAGWMRVCCP